jgi:uncharacterized protein (DUF433 family)/DNA-binding transcriptional MerR regulator
MEKEWETRLYLPAYQIKAAAAYSGISQNTVRNWQSGAISPRTKGRSLSYLQLQELAIVAVMRKLNVSLSAIRCARNYLASSFGTEFPFADERVKCDGQDVLVEASDLLKGELDILVVASKGGQYAWPEIIGRRFAEFEYERGVALKWCVAAGSEPIVIDPRVCFGAPVVSGGIPTWAIRGREKAGENDEDIAEDFRISVAQVRAALAFEHDLMG